MEDKQLVIDYLNTKKNVTLGTVTSDSTPQTHAIAFVNEDQTFYFVTDKNSRKAVNMKQNPKIAFSVYDETQDPNDLKYIQAEGTASLIEDEEEAKRIIAKLLEKFPFMKDMPENPNNVVIKLEPTLVYYSDYSKGWDHRLKVQF